MCAKRRATRPHTVPVRDKSMVTRPQKRTTRMKRGSGSMVTATTVESKARKASGSCHRMRPQGHPVIKVTISR